MLFRDLRLASEILKKSQERNLADRTINAQARAEELKAIWHGIDRSLQKFHVRSFSPLNVMNILNTQKLRAALNVDVLLNTVLQKLDVRRPRYQYIGSMHCLLRSVIPQIDHGILLEVHDTQLVRLSVC